MIRSNNLKKPVTRAELHKELDALKEKNKKLMRHIRSNTASLSKLRRAIKEAGISLE